MRVIVKTNEEETERRRHKKKDETFFMWSKLSFFAIQLLSGHILQVSATTAFHGVDSQ